jgi:hypothetical protein
MTDHMNIPKFVEIRIRTVCIFINSSKYIEICVNHIRFYVVKFQLSGLPHEV